MKYNFKKMTDTAILPTRHTPVSAGVDFYSDTDIVIPAGQSRKVSTGVSWNPDMHVHIEEKEYTNPFPSCTLALIIQSRSGYAFKHQIEASNAGVIDSDYTPNSESDAVINVLLYNHGSEAFHVRLGDKIAQGVLQLIPIMSDVESLDDDRQGRGFGSSDGKE